MENTSAVAAAPVRVKEWLTRITATAAYDYFVRAVFLAWYLYIANKILGGLLGQLETPDAFESRALFLSSIASRAAVLAFFATLVICVLLRRRAVAKAPGLGPRLSATAGTFLLLVLPLFPRQELSLTLNIVSTAVILAGNCLAIYVACWLGRSLSIMAEARRLVTGGPYRFVRHPLYVAEEIAVIGAFLQYASVWTVLLIVFQWLVQMERMRNEEKVLRAAFPADYDAYAARTARLIPGVY